MSGLEELYGEASEATTTPEAQPAPAPEAVTQAEPTVTPTAPAEATPAAITPPEPQEHSVPLNVLLRTREEFGGKLSAAERELATLRAEKAERERKAREAAEQAPDMLSDPEGYAIWSERRYDERVRTAVAQADARNAQALQAMSRNMMMRHLGPEKFGELDKFIQAAPDQAHAIALKQADPYGWFFEKYEQAQAHRNSQETLKQLDGRSIDDIVKDAVEKARGEWEAANAAPVHHSKRQPRDEATQQFAPSQPEQRHRPESLAKMNGAAVMPQANVGSALDALYPD